jgi:hypothetical protein
MRTTISVNDKLLRSAKKRARELGLTLGAFVENALRRELGRATSANGKPKIPVFRGKGGLRPGIDASSNRALLEALDEGLPVEKLR